MYPYASEADALYDVLRLSAGMTYKATAADLPLGGGKAVIWGDPRRDKSPALWKAFGQAVDSLNGKYITAIDSGLDLVDLSAISLHTSHVVGLKSHGTATAAHPYWGVDDTSHATALGVFHGMKTALGWLSPHHKMSDTSIALQGCGHVGMAFAKLCLDAGARLWIADVNSDKPQMIKKEYPQVEVVAPEEIHRVPCTVFAPCALGGILNEKTIAELQCRVVAGAANNQLMNPNADADRLLQRGILYLPDFVLNSGGLIHVSSELDVLKAESSIAYILNHVAQNIQKLLELSFANGRSPWAELKHLIAHVFPEKPLLI
jgi:leucine dehydrogenase